MSKDIQLRQNITNVPLIGKEYGRPRRLSYAKTILEGAPIFPKPLEYEDIDTAFFDFIDNEISLSIDGKRVETYTLYSSQRFSEYSQTWKHTDEEGNLLMNFKTVIRDNNPSEGKNQGGLWNIPGDRKYTLLVREVMEDNGTECYEIYSMKQPFAIDLSYRVNFITDKFENLNIFNLKLNDLFKSRQCYIRPNGHYLPMVIDEVNDETPYSIDDRKFYVQSISIKVMAYIIKESDFVVEKRPKRLNIAVEGDAKKKVKVNVDEFGDETMQNVEVSIIIEFEPYKDKVVFTMDKDVSISELDDENVRNFRLFLNDSPVYYEKGFKIKKDDKVKLKIIRYDNSEQSVIRFNGISLNEFYNANTTPEHVSDEETKYDEIIVE